MLSVDLGFFKRSRVDFWAWLVGPILLATVIHVSARVHHGNVDASLEWKKTFVRTVPGIEGKLDQANRVIDNFESHPVTTPSARELLGESIDAIARNCEFVVESLSIDRGITKEADHVAVLEVEVRGEGQLLNMTKFMDQLQEVDDLMDVASARIRVKNFAAGPLYYGEFVLRYYEIASE